MRVSVGAGVLACLEDPVTIKNCRRCTALPRLFTILIKITSLLSPSPYFFFLLKFLRFLSFFFPLNSMFCSVCFALSLLLYSILFRAADQWQLLRNCSNLFPYSELRHTSLMSTIGEKQGQKGVHERDDRLVYRLIEQLIL